MITLDTSIKEISRVGATTAKRLNKLDIEVVEDLLFYYPWRYDDYQNAKQIKNLAVGDIVNVVGIIELIQTRKSPQKRIHLCEAIINDKTEQLRIIWFNQIHIGRQLHIGDKISLSGKIEKDSSGLIMKSPMFEKINPHDKNARAVHTQGLVPNYHLTANITQKQLRFLIKQIIDLAKTIPDWLPKEYLRDQKMLSLGQAIEKIHFPNSYNDINKARERLAFNEHLLLQMQSQIAKQELALYRAEEINFKEEETKKFVKSLPFILTNAQKKAGWEIIKDLEKNIPMARMLEGDVGSGKTVVAVLGLLNVALNHKQSALMTPTEILAEQHFITISKLLAKTSINVALVTRSHTKDNLQTEQKKEIINKIKSGEIDIIIGTHALIKEKFSFKNLALAIIDEQHRFGVRQRKTLVEKSGDLKTIPHLLSMSATPIPRSLALALFNDLNISIISQMPKGRKAITTKIIEENNRPQAYNFVREQIKQGRQAYVICPLVDFSDKLGVKSVNEEYKKLSTIVFPDIKIGIIHGRMKTQEKSRVMESFKKNEIKILVSTSVVEVGVDVPNATMIIIEGADRFGLAQLHQFRGRVGRAEHQSFCFLFSGSKAPKTLERLNALVNCHDGFALAKMDLKLRGPGEIYGTEQKGFPEFKFATLFDQVLIKKAGELAKNIIKKDPRLEKHKGLARQLKELDQQVHLE